MKYLASCIILCIQLASFLTFAEDAQEQKWTAHDSLCSMQNQPPQVPFEEMGKCEKENLTRKGKNNLTKNRKKILSKTRYGVEDRVMSELAQNALSQNCGFSNKIESLTFQEIKACQKMDDLYKKIKKKHFPSMDNDPSDTDKKKFRDKFLDALKRAEYKKSWNRNINLMANYANEAMSKADDKFSLIINQLCETYGLSVFCKPINNQQDTGLNAINNRAITKASGGEIPIACIYQSAKKAKAIRPKYRYACLDDKASNRQAGVSSAPCLTENYIRYLHFNFNQALRCINSEITSDGSPGHIVKADEFFKIINHESGFQYNVRWKGGMGISQLTFPGFKEFADRKGPSYRRWEAVKNNGYCKPFKDILDKDIVYDPPNKKRDYATYGICQLLEQKVGVPRSIIIGMSLYKYKLKQANDLAKRLPFRSKNKEEVTRKIARLLYNQGYGAVEPAIKALIDYKYFKSTSFNPRGINQFIRDLEKVMEENMEEDEARRVAHSKARAALKKTPFKGKAYQKALAKLFYMYGGADIKAAMESLKSDGLFDLSGAPSINPEMLASAFQREFVKNGTKKGAVIPNLGYHYSSHVDRDYKPLKECWK